MKKKQVLAVSSALMIGTTTALTGLPTPVMAQENTEVVQEAVVEENKTEQVPVEQKTENAEVQENITDKEQEETAENAETLKEESTKQETPATPEKEVVTEDKTVEASKNTEVKAGSIAIDEAHFPDKVFREQIIYVFLTIFLYLPKCPQSLILSALRAFCFCGKPRISRSIFLYFPCQSWLKSW